MKPLFVLAGAAALGFAALSASTAPASAASCYYKLYQDGVGVVTGKLAITGDGHLAKKETACARARRECNRKFDRARKNGHLPRAAPRELRCVRVGT